MIGSAPMNAFAFAAQTKNLWMTSVLPQKPRQAVLDLASPWSSRR
jgi:hypothetical protein